MPANLENSTVPQYWKRSVFIPIPKKGNAKECSNYHTITPISHASKVILKILQGRIQQYMNQELPDIQVGFRKGRRSRDQVVNIHWIIKKARQFLKKSTFASLTMLKPLTVQIITNQKILRDGYTRPPYLTPEKPVCRSRSNSKSWTWNNRLVPIRERSMSRLYVVTLFM